MISTYLDGEADLCLLNWELVVLWRLGCDREMWWLFPPWLCWWLWLFPWRSQCWGFSSLWSEQDPQLVSLLQLHDKLRLSLWSLIPESLDLVARSRWFLLLFVGKKRRKNSSKQKILYWKYFTAGQKILKSPGKILIFMENI